MRSPKFKKQLKSLWHRFTNWLLEIGTGIFAKTREFLINWFLVLLVHRKGSHQQHVVLYQTSIFEK
jgi:hypothetical protein